MKAKPRISQPIQISSSSAVIAGVAEAISMLKKQLKNIPEK